MNATVGGALRLQPQIVPLVEARLRAREVGPKAARLSMFYREGERVPDGFCVIGTGDAAQALALDAYRKLGAEMAVAVRSSASAEDGGEASFAGQFETILNVRGEKAFAAALVRCWESVSGDRAEAYREHSGHSSGVALQMAVLVQQMVPARVAGVAFSANPLTGARDEVVIEAVSGLGDALVSGEVTPDSFVADPGGEIRVQTANAGQPSLSKAEAREIAALARRVEAKAGQPQDIEWAIDETGLWLLQARPISSLPEAARWESPVPGAKWMKDVMAAEWVTEPLSPLGTTSTLETMALARERASNWPPLPKNNEPAHTFINGWLYMRAGFRSSTLIANMLSSVFAIVSGTLNGHRRIRRRWPKRLAALDAFEQAELVTMAEPALHAQCSRLLQELGFWWVEVTVFASFARVGEQFIGQLGIEGLTTPAALFRGNESLLLEAERTLRRAAQNDAEVDDYLVKFGHFVESADPIHATLRESPEHLAWQMAAARQDEQGPDDRLLVIRRERTEAERTVRSARGLRGLFARKCLAVGQSHAAHTDDAVFHFQRVLAALRAIFLEVGRRLVAAGTLQRVDDVFFLELDELWDASSASGLQERIDERRAQRERHKRLAPPPFIPPLSQSAWSEDPGFKRMPESMRAAVLERGLGERNGSRVVVGSPASPGRARGTARVICSTADFGRFQPGDILVAHATSPIWTPLFGIASAAVTEVGGPLAHAAIVAREFGIPLVDGALEATRLIQDGMSIVVDGSAGVVEF